MVDDKRLVAGKHEARIDQEDTVGRANLLTEA